jgi:hypothetical protein
LDRAVLGGQMKMTMNPTNTRVREGNNRPLDRSNLSGKDRARFASMLIDCGADLSLRDDLLKSTALGWACRWGHLELVEL